VRAAAQSTSSWKPLTLTNMVSSGLSDTPSYASSPQGFSLGALTEVQPGLSGCSHAVRQQHQLAVSGRAHPAHCKHLLQRLCVRVQVPLRKPAAQ
jgi:hypothetical protein